MRQITLLSRDQRLILLTPLQQFLVRPNIHNPMIAHDHNLIGPLNRAQSMRHNNRRPSNHRPIDRFLHQMLRFGIERRCCFVQEEETAVGDESAGDGNSLFLASGEFHASFTDEGIVAFRPGDDEIVAVGIFARLFHLFRRHIFRIGNAVQEILTDAQSEQRWFLLHVADLLTQPLHVQIANVAVVQGDGALGNIVEALQEGHHRGFAAAGASHECRGGTRGYGKVVIAQDAHIGSGGVFELHAIELDPSFDGVRSQHYTLLLGH
mmetsp:Transcript_3616/g.3701  ORF Transcript_3616/g.3701 Transcript_3616/m.3701 type:complete len:265 (+) Transcript_3616:265-1059(+)